MWLVFIIFVMSQQKTLLTVKLSKLKYKQEFNDNMTIKNKPRITICKVAKPYTCISWILDFERFGIKNYSEDMISLMVKRVYDIAGCTEGNLLTYINGKNIKINNFNEYSLLYSPKSPNKVARL